MAEVKDKKPPAKKVSQPKQPEQPAETPPGGGLQGAEVDPTPNSHYTVAGVTAGKPTPETDPEAAEAARRAVRRS